MAANVRIITRKKITVTLNAVTAVPISITDIYVPDFEIYFPIENSGITAYVGNSIVDTGWIPRARGSSFQYTSGTGSLSGTILEVGFNLNNIYILGTALNDTAIVEYMYYDRS